jgi:hypothetical protein
MASQKDHVEVVGLLLACQGVEVNKTTLAGFTALYVASQNGHVEVVRLLLARQGLEVNKTAQDGSTALFMASQSGWQQQRARHVQRAGRGRAGRELRTSRARQLQFVSGAASVRRGRLRSASAEASAASRAYMARSWAPQLVRRGAAGHVAALPVRDRRGGDLV